MKIYSHTHGALSVIKSRIRIRKANCSIFPSNNYGCLWCVKKDLSVLYLYLGCAWVYAIEVFMCRIFVFGLRDFPLYAWQPSSLHPPLGYELHARSSCVRISTCDTVRNLITCSLPFTSPLIPRWFTSKCPSEEAVGRDRTSMLPHTCLVAGGKGARQKPAARLHFEALHFSIIYKTSFLCGIH